MLWIILNNELFLSTRTVYWCLPLFPWVSWTRIYIYIYTHFDPENGGSMYLRNVGNTSYIDTVKRCKSRISMNVKISYVDPRYNAGVGGKLQYRVIRETDICLIFQSLLFYIEYSCSD
jgi:hypothetical protein